MQTRRVEKQEHSQPRACEQRPNNPQLAALISSTHDRIRAQRLCSAFRTSMERAAAELAPGWRPKDFHRLMMRAAFRIRNSSAQLV